MIPPSPPDATRPAARVPSESGTSLRHVLLVGGTLGEWAAIGQGGWRGLVDELGGYCSSIGVPWLTIRAYREGPGDPESPPWNHQVEGCEVVVDPSGDGRRRFAEAMQRLDPADEVNEASVAALLYEPADCEPDLVVVVGPGDQLPPSLVWELAYAELVFLPGPWISIGAADLAAAVADFAGRRRRFGGLDEQ